MPTKHAPDYASCIATRATWSGQECIAFCREQRARYQLTAAIETRAEVRVLLIGMAKKYEKLMLRIRQGDTAKETRRLLASCPTEARRGG